MKTLITTYGEALDTDVIMVLCSCGDTGHTIVIGHDDYEEKCPGHRQFSFSISQPWGLNLWARIKQAWNHVWYDTYFSQADVLVYPEQAKELGQKLIELAAKDIEYQKKLSEQHAARYQG